MKYLLYLNVVAFLLGCGTDSKRHPLTDGTEGATDKTGGTGREDKACMTLVNGESTKEFPSVVLLLSQNSICTGTYITNNAVITAAHCVDGTANGGKRSVEGYKFSIQSISDYYNKGFKPKTAYWEGAPAAATVEFGDTDLAIIIFPEDSAPAISKLATVAPAPGDDITLVGFGITNSVYGSDNCDTFKKRTGTNTLIQNNGANGLYYVGRSETDADSGKTDDAVNAQGDSGGPVFINGKIAGIVSAGTLGTFDDPTATEQSITYSVDLSTPESQAFIQDVINSENLTIGQ